MRNNRPLFGANSTGRQPLPGAPKMDNWGTPKSDPFAPVVPVTPFTQERKNNQFEFPVPVAPPRHLEAPEGARTLDLRRYLSVPAGADHVDLMAYQCLPGAMTVIYYYSLIFPALLTLPNPDVEWFPTIDEQRVLQYHGSPGIAATPNPATNLNSPTGWDFSSIGLVRCQILMQPNQIFRWKVSNNTAGALVMGVRMVGYVDLTQQLQSVKMGD